MRFPAPADEQGPNTGATVEDDDSNPFLVSDLSSSNVYPWKEAGLSPSSWDNSESFELDSGPGASRTMTPPRTMYRDSALARPQSDAMVSTTPKKGRESVQTEATWESTHGPSIANTRGFVNAHKQSVGTRYQDVGVQTQAEGKHDSISSAQRRPPTSLAPPSSTNVTVVIQPHSSPASRLLKPDAAVSSSSAFTCTRPATHSRQSTPSRGPPTLSSLGLQLSSSQAQRDPTVEFEEVPSTRTPLSPLTVPPDTPQTTRRELSPMDTARSPSRLMSQSRGVSLAPGVTPQRDARPCRGSKDLWTVWYHTSGPDALQDPPHIECEPGELYLHSSTRTDQVQVWVKQVNGNWRIASERMPHPTANGRVLWFRSKTEPSWVTEGTVKTYDSKSRREEYRNSHVSFAGRRIIDPTDFCIVRLRLQGPDLDLCCSSCGRSN